jgi:hypothetical protein
MILKKPAPDVIRGGYRVPGCAKPCLQSVVFFDASAGEAGREKIMLEQSNLKRNSDSS